MWRKRLTRFSTAVILTLLGCGGPPPQPAPNPPPGAPEAGTPPAAAAGDPSSAAARQAELVAKWKEAAQAETPDTAAYQAIAADLSMTGPDAVLPLLDILGDPQESPTTKVAVVNSLVGLVTPGMVDRLTRLTGPENDATTRACAVHLLGGLGSDAVISVLRKLVDDPERRIRFAALRGLAMAGDTDGRTKFAALYDAPDTSIREREAIARYLANDAEHFQENVPLLAKVLRDAELSPDARRIAVSALSSAGGSEAVSALREAAEKDPDQYIREVAASAAALLDSAQAEPAPPAQSDAPPANPG